MFKKLQPSSIPTRNGLLFYKRCIKGVSAENDQRFHRADSQTCLTKQFILSLELKDLSTFFFSRLVMFERL